MILNSTRAIPVLTTVDSAAQKVFHISQEHHNSISKFRSQISSQIKMEDEEISRDENLSKICATISCALSE